MPRPKTGAYSGYVGRKRGRPKADPPCHEPKCSKCRRMAVEVRPHHPVCVCRNGHVLGTAATCPDYSDASAPRPNLLGGTTGIPAR